MKKLVLMGISIGFIVVVSEGANIYFNGASTPDQLWSSTANWNLARLPVDGDVARYNLVGGEPLEIADGTAAVATHLFLARNHAGPFTGNLQLIQDGATSSLTLSGQLQISNDVGGKGEYVLNNGTVSVGNGQYGSAWIGGFGSGTLTVNGGQFNASNSLNLGMQSNSSGLLSLTGGEVNLGDQSAQGMNLVMYKFGTNSTSHVQLDGGILRAFRIENMVHADANATIDFAGGTMVVTGNRITETAGYIKAGIIGSYGYYWQTGDLVSDYFRMIYDSDSNRTTIEAVVAGYDFWSTGWIVDIGAKTNDYDGDLLDNLYEYAVGGDPTNALDMGYVPTFGLDAGSMAYVHAQRTDDATLAYYLETIDDLVDGIWTNGGYSVTDTNTTGGTFDFVTNTIPTTADQVFVRLTVED